MKVEQEDQSREEPTPVDVVQEYDSEGAKVIRFLGVELPVDSPEAKVAALISKRWEDVRRAVLVRPRELAQRVQVEVVRASLRVAGAGIEGGLKGAVKQAGQEVRGAIYGSCRKWC